MRILILALFFLSGDVRLQPVKPEPVICQSVDKFYRITEFFKYSEYSEVRHIILAVAIMLWYFSSKGYPIDEKGFMLKLEGYADDELHTKKVKWIANKFRRK